MVAFNGWVSAEVNARASLRHRFRKLPSMLIRRANALADLVRQVGEVSQRLGLVDVE